MQDKLFDIVTFEDEGYMPLIDFNCWRVAFLRFIDELLPENIIHAEKHLETDEVFVLLAGRALLIIGTGEDSIDELTYYEMEPCKLYNVKQSTWHNVVLSTDATILLVENRNTTSENTAYCKLNEGQRAFIQKMTQDKMLFN